MHMKKILTMATVIGVGLVFLAAIVIGVTGYWPIAKVDSSFITYDAFKQNFMMADHFYRSNVKITGEDERVVDAKEVQKDLQRATLEGLIEQIVIDSELKRRYTDADLSRLIENKISGIDLAADNMKKATDLLYGLTPEQFKELVLIPKAKQELLEGNITLQGGTFDDWLAGKKKEIHVSIFVPSLSWDGTAVKAN